MSRIGKLPITVPSGVTVTLTPSSIAVKGPKGELKRDIHPQAKVTQEGTTITVTPADDSRTARCMWGLTRTLIANMVEGVTKEFTKELIMKGVGYKVALKGKDLDLALGFSHPVLFKAPAGITFDADPKKLTIKITGISKELVGQTASEIRSFRKPEPYKGKGIAYAGEVILRKAGKTAGKK